MRGTWVGVGGPQLGGGGLGVGARRSNGQVPELGACSTHPGGAVRSWVTPWPELVKGACVWRVGVEACRSGPRCVRLIGVAGRS